MPVLLIATVIVVMYHRRTAFKVFFAGDFVDENRASKRSRGLY
jgi:hypothetical protein